MTLEICTTVTGTGRFATGTALKFDSGCGVRCVFNGEREKEKKNKKILDRNAIRDADQ